MHRVPASRADWRVIDGERVCEALAALERAENSERWSTVFSLLGDAGRLNLLVAMHAAEPISVSDLSLATVMRDTAVSQVLRRLRDLHLVAAQRDGKVIRYSLVSPELRAILHLVGAGQHAGA